VVTETTDIADRTEPIIRLRFRVSQRLRAKREKAPNIIAFRKRQPNSVQFDCGQQNMVF
jgi:hypothetical protein